MRMCGHVEVPGHTDTDAACDQKTFRALPEANVAPKVLQFIAASIEQLSNSWVHFFGPNGVTLVTFRDATLLAAFGVWRRVFCSCEFTPRLVARRLEDNKRAVRVSNVCSVPDKSQLSTHCLEGDGF